MRQGFKHFSRRNRRFRQTQCQNSASIFTRLSESTKGIYRSRNGVIMGVCKGLSEHFGIPLFWLRALFITMLLLGGVWPMMGLYFLAAFMLKPRPLKAFETEHEKEFYNSYVDSRKNTVRALHKRYKQMEHKIERMEEIVTGKEFEWDRKFHAGS